MIGYCSCWDTGITFHSIYSISSTICWRNSLSFNIYFNIFEKNPWTVRFLLYSLRLRICFCFYDFAVYLEIRYGNSSSVVCREAWTGPQSGSCLGQKFSDNFKRLLFFCGVSFCECHSSPEFPLFQVLLNVPEFYLYNGKSTSISK